VIRVERATLPEGLRAIAYRDHHGNLVVCVSEELDSGSQRAAVIDAMRAARRVGWRAGLPPAGIALFLAVRALLHRVARPFKARPAAWGTAAAATATVAAVSAYFLVTAPHPGNPSAGQQPGPSAVAPASPHGRQPAPAGGSPSAGPAHAGTSARGGSPGDRGVVSPISAAVGPGPASPPVDSGTPPPTAPAPTPSPSRSPQPTPEPTPSPGPGSGVCIKLLGAKVCLRL
jgi:hypothetical protein